MSEFHMDPRQAKLQTLQDLIGAMDEHMLGPAKARKQAAAVQPPLAPPAEQPPVAAAAPDQDGLDADTAAKLRKLYEDDEDLSVAPAVPMA